MRDYYGQPAFRRLLVWLKANDGSGYGCIELNSFDAIEEFIEELRTRSQKKIVEINYSGVHPDENKDLIVADHQYLTMENYRKKFGDDAVLVITHLAETIDSSNEKEVTALINEINMNRENYVNYPSQVLFVLPVWFMDRIYQEAHDFKSMIGFHADLTKVENKENPAEPRMDYPQPKRQAPNRKMMDTYREDFENENLPINLRLTAGKKYIDVCTYFYFLDEEELALIRRILTSFDENRERNDKIRKLVGEVRKILEENLKTRELFSEWINRPKTEDKKENSDVNEAVTPEERVEELKNKEDELNNKLLDLTKGYAEIAGELRGKFAYRKALELDERAMRLREWVLPEDDLVLADSYNVISVDFYYLLYYKKALEYSKKALSIREKVLPADHPDLAKSYNNIGAGYSNLGDHRKALEYLEKALSIREKMLPADHPDLAKSYNNIGADYTNLGDYRKALEYLEKALSIREKVLPAYHPDLAMSYYNVGNAYLYLGDYRKALEYHEKALSILEKVLPADHPKLAKSYNNIGADYTNLGDYRKALEYHEKALSIREKVLPVDHPDLAMSYYNVGNDYLYLGDYRKALEYHEKALSIREKVLPVDHSDLAKIYNNIGVDYEYLEDYKSALEYYEKAFEIKQKVFPEDHAERVRAKNNLTNLKKKMRNS